jgi:hypothetical protein
MVTNVSEERIGYIFRLEVETPKDYNPNWNEIRTGGSDWLL